MSTILAQTGSMWNHWALRANHPHQPFTSFKLNHWVWTHLKEQFPHAVSAMLMPNHLHLLLPKHTHVADLEKLRGLQGAISLKFLKIPKLWQPCDQPKIVPDMRHFKRTVRYIALNPCRHHLCSDPLEWVWSTYRDLFGSVVNPWVTCARLSRELREPSHDFAVRFHAYVSGDPTVSINGTPPPRAAAAPTRITKESINHIALAAAAALRLPTSEIKRTGHARKLFLHLARRQGWKQTSTLAEVTGMTVHGVRKILHEPAPTGIEAAAICLANDRFLKRVLDDIF